MPNRMGISRYPFRLPLPNPMCIVDEEDGERKKGILMHPGNDVEYAGSSRGRRGRRVAHGLSRGTRVVRCPSGRACGGPSRGGGPSRPSGRGRGGLSRGGGPSLKVKVKNREPNGPLGQTVAEVFWIRLDNGGQLHGKLKIVDALFDENEDLAFDVYFPDRNNLRLLEGYEARLSGLSRPIIATDDFMVKLNLWDDTSSLSEEEGEPIPIYWTGYGFFSYDQPRTSTITCKFGIVTARYVIMENAGEARLEIRLNGSSQDPANVYGSITARCSVFDEEIHLFDRGAYEYVTISSHDAIPLLRSVVNVPMDSTLVIEADIRDCMLSSPIYLGIGQGTAEFEPDIFRSSVMPIKGNSGEIAVTVYWL